MEINITQKEAQKKLIEEWCYYYYISIRACLL